MSTDAVPIATAPIAAVRCSPLLDERIVTSYLQSTFGADVRGVHLAPLGQPSPSDAKGYGFGIPVRADFELRGTRRSVVLETVPPRGLGHEHMADRARILLWSHGAFNALPQHVRSLDVGVIRRGGALVSVGDADEFFILTEFADGDGYVRDLERLRDGGELGAQDVARSDALCDYLVGIHKVRGKDPALYLRRVRELVGGNDGIAGILDSYPRDVDGIDSAQLLAIEHACVDRRWRLKPFAHRLRQVHGDFHPWNVRFQKGVSFLVLDRSRGEWGEPADDVACLAIHYLFFSLQRTQQLSGGFAALFSRFWQRYVQATDDRELAAVIAPFFAFRALAIASPVWNPNLAPAVRRRLVAFARAVLEAPQFEPAHVNTYL